MRGARFWLAGLCAVAAAFFAGCGGPAGIEDLEQPVELEVGDTFELALDANSSTGYEWQLLEEPDSEIVRYDGSDYEADPDDADRDGGGGEQTLSFTAIAPGETRIELGYLFDDGGERRPPSRRLTGEFIVR